MPAEILMSKKRVECLGAIGLIPATIGMVAGGIIANKLNLQLRGFYMMAFWTSSVALIFSFPYLIPCSTPAFAGINAKYDGEPM
jgi:hypothetical protein